MTRCVDNAICPKCNEKFSSEPLSEEGPQYEYDCPHCGAKLSIFESVEYQVEIADDQ